MSESNTYPHAPLKLSVSVLCRLQVKVKCLTRAPIHRTPTSLKDKTADNGYHNPIALYAVPKKLKKVSYK